jgi:hypothetical protein
MRIAMQGPERRRWRQALTALVVVMKRALNAPPLRTIAR